MSDRDTFDLFTYGSMQDVEVLGIVLGRPVDASIYRPAYLAGHRVMCVPEETYPVLVESAGTRASGALISGLTEPDLARVRFFESEEYELVYRDVHLERGETQSALVCVEGRIGKMDTTLEPWTLPVWRARHKKTFLTLIAAFMSVYGKGTLEEAEALWLTLEDDADSNVA